MLFIKDIKPSLNIQSDFIRAKPIHLTLWYFYYNFILSSPNFSIVSYFVIIPIVHANIFIVSRFIYSCFNF